MAREIVSWCDVCLRADPPVHEAGIEVIGGFDRDKPRRIDLCEVHRKEFIEPAQTLFRDEGVIIDALTSVQAVGPSSRAGGRLLGPAASANAGPYCPVPGCASEGRRFKNEDTMLNHGSVVHKLKRPAMRALMAEQPTLDGTGTEPAEPASELPGTDETFACDVEGCDKSYPPERFNRPAQALGVHKATAHGIRAQSK